MLRHTIVVLLVVALGAPGCATRSRAMSSPGAMQTGGSQAASEGPPGSVGWRQVASRLPAGSRVRLQLTDGVRLTGIVMAADDAAIVVKPKTRIPEPERRIPYAAIEMLEQDTGGLSVGKAVAIGVGAGAAAFLAIVFITFALIDD